MGDDLPKHAMYYERPDGSLLFCIHLDGSMEGDLDEMIRLMEQEPDPLELRRTTLGVLYAIRRTRDEG